MGLGGMNMEIGCEKKIVPGPAQTTSSSTSVQQNARLQASFEILILWFFEQTSNTKDVKHETTIPNM